MESKTKVCKNCSKAFLIEPDDFAFYEKIAVPPPTLCPNCRQQRRYAWRNERTLYRRPCDLCGKSTVSIYSKNKPFKVYCPTCWWGDGWDASDYGRDFDFSRPFFEQFQELQHEVPRIALLGKNSVNSEYSNHSSDNRNCFMVTSCVNGENVMYSNWIMESRDVMDSLYINEKLERSYECVDSQKCYRCQFGVQLQDCTECLYCYDCRGCTNCFLSVNLRGKSYVFLNQQYTKEQYFEKVKTFQLGSWKDRQKLIEQFQAQLMRAIRKPVMNENNVNVVGSSVSNSKNVYQSFDLYDAENARYVVSALHFKDCMDCYHFGYKSELIYDTHAAMRSYCMRFSHLSYDDSYVTYCDTCHNCQNMFGCVSVKKGEYMILNKKYSPDEYQALQDKIIAHMKTTGEFGEFFPISLSPFGYNETQANVYMPMTRDEVHAKGWAWEDEVIVTYGKETMQPEEIPDNIADVDESILKAILKCSHCNRNYNIVKPELDFYRRESIPVPRLCYDCRYMRRIALRASRKLYERTCMKCSAGITTPYSPDRPEIVYCEQCYQNEVL